MEIQNTKTIFAKIITFLKSNKPNYPFYTMGFCPFMITEIPYSFWIKSESIEYIQMNGLNYSILLIISLLLLGTLGFFRNKANQFHLFFLLCYTGFIFYKFIYYPFHTIFLFELIIAFVLSFTIFKKNKWYYSYVALIFGFLAFLYFFEIIPTNNIFLLFNMLLIIGLINHNVYSEKVKANHNLLFASTIIQRGNSIVIALNKSNELIFCSDAITKILGFEPKEVLGDNFKKLTESKGYLISDEPNTTSMHQIETDYLLCKNGEKKYIQWTKKKYSDNLFVCFGNDISEKIDFEKSYERLVELAPDLIGEVDFFGNYTYANKNTEKIIGYTLEELYSINSFKLVRGDYRKQIISIYSNIPEDGKNYPELEFPIINKSGETIWLSQKVTPKKNHSGEITGFLVIARDITRIKMANLAENKRRKKTEKYNKLSVGLNMTNFSNFNSFEESIKNIIEKIATKTGISLVSYWEYKCDKLVCIACYNSNSESHSVDYEIKKEEHVAFFEEIEKKEIIAIPNLNANMPLLAICNSLFDDVVLKSILESPVFINGKLEGVVFFGSFIEVKNWDECDLNLATTSSDIIAIAIQENRRKLASEKIVYNNQLLSAINENTEKILTSKTTSEIFKKTLQAVGEVLKLDKITYCENNAETQTLTQKYLWIKETKSFANPLEELKNINYTLIPGFLEYIHKKANYKGSISKVANPILKKMYVQHNVKSILVYPVIAKDNFVGLLSFIENEVERFWTKDEVNILQTLINNIQLVIEQNINEQIINESEEKFKLLANNIPGTVYLSYFDEKCTKNYVNDEIENLTGYEKKFFLTNEICLIDIIHPLDKEYVESETRNCLSDGKPFHLTYRVQKKTGEIIWVEDYGDAIRKDNKILYIEGILIDITQKKDAEAAIVAKELAEAATKSKSDFLANMSHEIRTPLNAIIGFTELLLQTNLNESQNQYLKVVNHSGETLMEIINNILDFSKIESGKLELEIKKTKLKKICEQIIEIVKYEAHQKNIAINLNIDPNIQNYMWVDSFRLKQIIINLLANAIKFTTVGNIELRIELLDNSEDNFQKIRFSVIDTGIGIKQSSQKKIFDAFSQEDNSTTRKYGGTGLGLSISNKLLSLMNSRLQVNSVLQKGSTFYFDLQLNTEYSNDENEENAIEKLFIPEKINTNKTEILLVDDNKINVLLAKTIIQKSRPNAIIKECYNGIEALDYCKTNHPSIIFMDVQMPLMNGFEATKEIRKIEGFEKIPIIAFTAGTILGEKEKCLNNGMNDYIPKPVTQNSIIDALNNWTKN